MAKSSWWCPGVRPVMWLSEPQFFHLYSGVVMANLPGLGAQSLALSRPNAARVGYSWVQGCPQARVGARAGGADAATTSSWLRPAGTLLLVQPPYLLLQMPALILSLSPHSLFLTFSFGGGEEGLCGFSCLLPFVFSSWVLPALPSPPPSSPAALIPSLPPALPPGSPISLSLMLPSRTPPAPPLS